MLNTNAVTDVLFYDGSCPLCRREIALLRRLSRPTLAFVDIHSTRDSSLPPREDLLRLLHLRRANGELVLGFAANIAMWQHTSWGWAWRLLTVPGIRPGVEWLYNRWAERRFRRLYACGLNQEP